MMNNFFLFLASCFLLHACGGDNLQTNDRRPTTNGEFGAVKAIVTNSKSFNPNIFHGKITQYKVTISGSDITEPVVAIFDGSAESGVIDGVPAGDNRQIKVEAINPNNITIREGDVSGLSVRGGEIAEVQVSMESVPVFANLAAGNVIPNTRFIAKVFSDPADTIIIEDESNGASYPLFDVSVNNTEIYPDASTGIATISPPLIAAGEHKFTAKNTRTNRSSTIVVRLADGSKLKAAPIYGAASVLPVRFGQAVMGY